MLLFRIHIFHMSRGIPLASNVALGLAELENLNILENELHLSY